jgi:RsiW-degrading membrane proteinase PrsW (M82 family)
MISVINFFESELLVEFEMLDNIKENAIKSYQIKINEIKKQLIQAKVDVALIENIVKKHSVILLKELKQGNATAIKSHFFQILDEMQESQLIIQFTVSILTLISVLIISFLCEQILLGMGFSAVISSLLGVILVAPIVEEGGKLFSVKQKSTGVYYFVFNLVEYTLYVAGSVIGGAPVISASLTRIVCALMHWVTTTIHFEANKEGRSKTGYALAVFIHAMWNFLGSLKEMQFRPKEIDLRK